MNPVSLVTIHHEGAGTPSDVPRGAAGGYTYWVGLSRWEHLRDVWQSYATLDFNHVSLDICLSGNRMTSPVTDPDIQLIRGAFADARARGYVIPNPTVRPHRFSPGSSTVCPGDLAMVRWNDIVNACRDVAMPPTEEPMRFLFPSPHQNDPNKFRGAVVDCTAKHITLAEAATCEPVPVIDNPNPWLGAFPGPAPFSFTVVTDDDHDDYHYTLTT